MKTSSFIFIIVSFYIIYASHDTSWHTIDFVNLIFHEGGHVIMRMFGEWIYIAGGSCMQIAIPLLVALHFLKNDEQLGMSLAFMWMGQSIINVGIYAYDGADMFLPLIGGDDVIHDWNFLLESVNMLSYAHAVGNIIKGLGYLVVYTAFLYGIFLCIYRKNNTHKERGFTLYKDQ